MGNDARVREARAMVKKADDLLASTSRGWSLFSNKDEKYEEAVKNYETAAGTLGANDLFREQAQTLEKMLEVQRTKQDYGISPVVLKDIFKAYKKAATRDPSQGEQHQIVDPKSYQDAERILQMFIEVSREKGRVYDAARMVADWAQFLLDFDRRASFAWYKTAGELIVKDEEDYSQSVVDYYTEAGFLAVEIGAETDPDLVQVQDRVVAARESNQHYQVAIEYFTQVYKTATQGSTKVQKRHMLFLPDFYNRLILLLLATAPTWPDPQRSMEQVARLVDELQSKCAGRPKTKLCAGVLEAIHAGNAEQFQHAVASANVYRLATPEMTRDDKLDRHQNLEQVLLTKIQKNVGGLGDAARVGGIVQDEDDFS